MARRKESKDVAPLGIIGDPDEFEEGHAAATAIANQGDLGANDGEGDGEGDPIDATDAITEVVAERPGRRRLTIQEAAAADKNWAKPGKTRKFLVTMRHSPAIRKSLLIIATCKADALAKFKRLNEKAARASKNAAKYLAAWQQAMGENPPTWQASVEECGKDVDQDGKPWPPAPKAGQPTMVESFVGSAG